MLVDVQYNQQQAKQLPLIVVEGEGPPLLGRNWLHHLHLDWKEIKTVTRSQKDLNSLLDNYTEVFQDELGHMSDFKAKLLMHEGAKPKFCMAKSVPYVMKSAIKEELDRLERIGVLRKIPTSEWATPIVAVPKKDNTMIVR